MESIMSIEQRNDMLSYEGFRNAVIEDYRVAVVSREVSLLGRREVLTGKAKFGIFGDGKEVAQIAMAKFFRADLQNRLVLRAKGYRKKQPMPKLLPARRRIQKKEKWRTINN